MFAYVSVHPDSPHATSSSYHFARIPVHVSRIMYHASRIMYHASRITYHVSRITHHVSRIAHHVLRITYHVSQHGIYPHHTHNPSGTHVIPSKVSQAGFESGWMNGIARLCALFSARLASLRHSIRVLVGDEHGTRWRSNQHGVV